MKNLTFLKKKEKKKQDKQAEKGNKKRDISRKSEINNYKILKTKLQYIKAFPLLGLADIPSIQSELKVGNIVILNISHFLQDFNNNYREIKRVVEQLSYISKVYEGEIAQLGDKYILITPNSNIKIWKDKLQVNG